MIAKRVMPTSVGLSDVFLSRTAGGGNLARRPNRPGTNITGFVFENNYQVRRSRQDLWSGELEGSVENLNEERSQSEKNYVGAPRKRSRGVAELCDLEGGKSRPPRNVIRPAPRKVESEVGGRGGLPAVSSGGQYGG